jgi:hypothetical protein
MIARFNSSGRVLWRTPNPGGKPISPVIVNGDTILIACEDGPISLFSYTDGTLLGSLTITDPGGNPYDTVNTPAVNGNAVYISLQKGSDQGAGELVKVLVNPGASPVLSVAWTFPYGGPSGGSPHYSPATNTVYFDGASLNPDGSGPHLLFAVIDAGNSPQLNWTVAMPAKVPAAVAQDPRGGVWAFSATKQYLWRFNEADGSILQTIDVNALIGPATRGAYSPSSALTITPNSVMLLGAAVPLGNAPSYVAALDLSSNAGALIWKYQISNAFMGDTAVGQFPIVIDASGTANIAFTTFYSGARFLTPSPCCWRPSL